MQTAFQQIASNASRQMGKRMQTLFGFLASIALLIVLFSSCSADNVSHEDPEAIDTTECKNMPGEISFGRDVTDIVYDMQGKPIKITTSEFNIAAPTAPPVTTIYTIDYNAQENAAKVSKSVDNQPESYYQMEYNSGGKLIKQSEFNAQGVLIAYTMAQYDAGNVLTRITTYKENTSVEVTSIYQYTDGNLIKKSIQNLYDQDTQEYYNADFTYTYFLDKENKIKSYFEGPLGLLFISNLSNQQSLQYLPDSSSYQLFYARETSFEKKMLKNMEIIAHRYNTSDTTHIDYTYEYGTDGFPTFQRGTYRNVTRRYVATPFGGSVLLVTPNDNTMERTMNFSCN